MEKDRFSLVGATGETVDAPGVIAFEPAPGEAKRSLIDVSEAAAAVADVEEPRPATLEIIQTIHARIEEMDDLTAAKTREWMKQREGRLTQAGAQDLLASPEERMQQAP